MKSITEGWVIVGDEQIYNYTFHHTKRISIEYIEFLKRQNWEDLQKAGYRCVKSTRTIEIKGE